MKNKNLLLTFFITILIFGCSSDDNDEIQLSFEELLTQGSPWTYEDYELINIIDAGNSNFTQTDIENSVDISQNGNVITFNTDGTGSSFLPSDGTDNWEWRIVNGDQLEITFESNDIDIIETINIINNQLVIEIESVSFDEEVLFEIEHFGRFIYE